MSYNIEIKEGLNTIEIFDGREFTYRFTPARYSKGAPLLVIASAKGTRVPSKFNREDWNVLSVVDTFGRQGDTTGYMGEHGNFFIKELLTELIQVAMEECKCSAQENLFFYSSSVASGGTLIQGILFEARAVYLNAPIIKVIDSTMYKSQFMECDQNIDFVFPSHMKDSIEADGVRFLKAHRHKKMPTFFLCDSMHQSEDWLQNFLEEHTLYFVNACKEEGVEVHLELVDTEGHKIHHSTLDAIKLFEKHTPPKYLDLFSLHVSLNNQTLTARLETGKDYPDKDNALIAFYLMYDGERIDAKSYSQEKEVHFSLEERVMDYTKLEVIGWLKSKGAKVIKKKVAIQ